MLCHYPGDNMGLGDGQLHCVWVLCGREDMVTYPPLLWEALVGAPECGQIVGVVMLLELLLLLIDKRLHFLMPCCVVDVKIPRNDDIVWGVVASGVDCGNNLIDPRIGILFACFDVCCFVIIIIISGVGIGVEIYYCKVAFFCCYCCGDVVISCDGVMWEQGLFCNG